MFVPCSPEFFSWKNGALSEETAFMAGHASIANVACFFHSDAAAIFVGPFCLDFRLDFHQFFPNVDWRETTNNHNFEPDVIMDSPITFGVSWAHLSTRFTPEKCSFDFVPVESQTRSFPKEQIVFVRKIVVFFWHLSSLSVSPEIPWCPDGILRPISSSSIGIESLIHSEYVIPIRNVCRFASPKKVDFLNDFNKIPSDYSFVVLDFCVPSYLGERSLTSIKLQGGWNHQTATR